MRDLIRAARDRDPAARGLSGLIEVVLSYPGFHAVLLHRAAHALWRWRLCLCARAVSQFARWLTGIEIHPGAEIGRGFFIDHGMAVVIGETTVIGDSVTLYQGVTLGGSGKETGKRHPTLHDNVVVGAGASVLGNIAVGRDVRIGAGSVVVKDVPDHCTVVGVPARVVRHKGERVAQHPLDHAEMPDPVQQKMNELERRLQELEIRLDDGQSS
ncbi:MAG: serine O-acetyltransferase [Candidatus Eisenbacteria bacterium]|nr:serine O-acetyltransferase [Candidatus Eisenbacteria bacterium]